MMVYDLGLIGDYRCLVWSGGLPALPQLQCLGVVVGAVRRGCSGISS